MPTSATTGSWRPDASAYGSFAYAAASRYSGSYPDPLAIGQTLPRVTSWQAWAEPNLGVHLSPQWSRHGRAVVPASPTIYRGLLNAFFDAVKRVHTDNLVVTGGTAPFGDLAGGQRMSPALFVRELLCLHGRAMRRESCPSPAHFDALAHHPYSVGVPTTKALNPDDVSVPDLSKLARPLTRAVKLGLAVPRARKRLWITEFSYDSSPPDPRGVPIKTHARWLEQALFLFWRQGVDTVTWYLVRDQPPVPDYGSTYQSGVYYLDGSPKPALQAFRFPFVVGRTRGGGRIAWGSAPLAGTVEVDQRRRGRWLSVARVGVGVHSVFVVHLAGRGRAAFRATVNGQDSLIWTT